MNEGVFTYTTASIMRQACSTHGIKMVRCTDLALDCAPQRLLRRGGEADLEEKRGNGVNETHTFTTRYTQKQRGTSRAQHNTVEVSSLCIPEAAVTQVHGKHLHFFKSKFAPNMGNKVLCCIISDFKEISIYGCKCSQLLD